MEDNTGQDVEIGISKDRVLFGLMIVTAVLFLIVSAGSIDLSLRTNIFYFLWGSSLGFAFLLITLFVFALLTTGYSALTFNEDRRTHLIALVLGVAALILVLVCPLLVVGNPT